MTFVIFSAFLSNIQNIAFGRTLRYLVWLSNLTYVNNLLNRYHFLLLTIFVRLVSILFSSLQTRSCNFPDKMPYGNYLDNIMMESYIVSDTSPTLDGNDFAGRQLGSNQLVNYRHQTVQNVDIYGWPLI